ncbi:MAG: 2-C-methyl-D-erythritol 4-phosphate cytidylyltransferase [Chloroflexi bacterium]|nr:2-C-methyl-D-erythritol 4-phosphate cytidylyltransferase [Chloroflexota bacterium]
MSGIDKIFAPLGGHPLIYWPLRAAQSCPLVDRIVVLLSARNIDQGRSLVARHGFSKVVSVREGGERRQDTVRIGLGTLSGCEWVLIQDAARPFLDATLIADGLAAAAETGAALAAVPVKDTIKIADQHMFIGATPDRATLWAAQTPQVFRFDIIAAAYKLPDGATDDASLVEKLGHRVKLYQGSYDNIKVTTPEDLALAETLLKRRQCA